MMHEGFHWWMPFPGFVWLILLGAIVAVLVAVFRSRGSAVAPRASRSALDILDERYARGEIDREEYVRRKSDLA